jgi:hypothetical protein
LTYGCSDTRTRCVTVDLDALLAHLNASPTHLLDPAPLAAMQQIDTPGKRYDVGLGWCRPSAARSSQPRYVEHLGGGLGIYNVMRLYPELGLAIVVSSNTPGYDRDAMITPLVTAFGLPWTKERPCSKALPSTARGSGSGSSGVTRTAAPL